MKFKFKSILYRYLIDIITLSQYQAKFSNGGREEYIEIRVIGIQLFSFNQKSVKKKKENNYGDMTRFCLILPLLYLNKFLLIYIT